MDLQLSEVFRGGLIMGNCETCKYCVTDEDKLFCENMKAAEWFEEVSADHRCPLWEEKDAKV